MNYRRLDDGYRLREWSFMGPIGVIELMDPKLKDLDNCVSYCLITTASRHVKIESIILWHIQTHRDYLRRGYARRLIGVLQENYDEIVSQVNVHEGNELLKSCGFVQEENNLIWRKEVIEDGKGTSEIREEELVRKPGEDRRNDNDVEAEGQRESTEERQIVKPGNSKSEPQTEVIVLSEEQKATEAQEQEAAPAAPEAAAEATEAQQAPEAPAAEAAAEKAAEAPAVEEEKPAEPTA